MNSNISRRKFLHSTASGVGAAGMLSAFPWAMDAKAAIQLTGVQWGGPWVESNDAVNKKQDMWDVRWELHTGGSAAIIPKIKAAWPNVRYDFVTQYNPLYYIWAREDWAEPFTEAEMPNLKDLAQDQIHRNSKGEAISIPLSIGGAFWGYRKDICPIEITRFEDLLTPKLKGQLVVRDAVQGLNNNGVSYALGNGGGERNMEPGWEFLQKLAKSGNIARIGKAETDFINALTTGEASAGFWNMGGWGTVAKDFPVEFLIKDKATHPGFQVFTFNEGFMMPKVAPNKEAAKEYLNWFISPENNTEYNRLLNYAPSNSKSTGTELSKVITFKTQAERDKYYHNLDWDHLSKKKDEMITRFEKEIIPLLE